MNTISLSWASIRNRKLPSFLCVMAVACGLALLVSVYLLFSAAEKGLIRNAQGVDVVVGAKGSPLQLVLSTIYHGDIPTGNIDMHEMEDLARNRDIKKIIPLAIGDNYRGFRVVGTTPDYIDLYAGKVSQGRTFSANYEVVAGSLTGLAVGTKFAAAHGFSADSDDVHDDDMYTVVGTLETTGSVLDRLVLTPYQSVQDLHSHHDHHEEPEGAHHHDDADEAAEMGHQITALLLKVNSPAARMNLPREINSDAHVMAASPSHVMARLMKNFGLGRDAAVLIGGVFLMLAVLMLLSVLASGLAQRRYDIAVLRVLGASSTKIAATVLVEALILAAIGSACGIVIGHIIAFTVATSWPALQSLFLPSVMLSPVAADIWFCLIGLLCGAVSSMVPCLTAARTDIAGVLAQGR